MLAGTLLAQQTPAATTQTAPAAKTHAPAAKSATASKTAAPLTLKTEKEKVSYALGMSIGTNAHQAGADLDPALVARGLKDALAGGKTLLTPEEAQTALNQQRDELRTAHAEANRKAGVAFLEANKTKEGVVTLPSGLQYKILKDSDGPKPASTDTVTCNYRGTLIDGTEFDSSYKRGQPAEFPVSGVIKGWTEALQLMPVGAKWQLFVPSDLAYGQEGRPGIAPNSTLIFEVELLSIKGRTPAPNAAPQGDDVKPKINNEEKQ